MCIGYLDKTIKNSGLSLSFIKFGSKFSYHLDYLSFQWKSL